MSRLHSKAVPLVVRKHEKDRKQKKKPKKKNQTNPEITVKQLEASYSNSYLFFPNLQFCQEIINISKRKRMHLPLAAALKL